MEKVAESKVDQRRERLRKETLEKLKLYPGIVNLDFFEEAFEDGLYEEFVIAKPDQLVEIFGRYISECAYPISKTDIKYFQSRGVNLNKSDPEYRSDSKRGTTPLGHACEFRKIDLMVALCECGVDVNQKDDLKFSPFEILLMGHSALSIEYWEDVEKGTKILQQYGAKFSAQKWILDESTDSYKEHSPYLKEILSQHTVVLNNLKREEREEEDEENEQD